jgi:hypothetical protein
MTDHTVEGFDRGVSQRARGHLQLVHTEVDTVCGDGVLACRDPAPSRLGWPDDDEPEHDITLLAW